MKYYAFQVSRASSRLLNALTGGEGDVTFSAWSYHLMINKHSAWGALRVKWVDHMLGEGHCARSYTWHEAHDLIRKDELTV